MSYDVLTLDYISQIEETMQTRTNLEVAVRLVSTTCFSAIKSLLKFPFLYLHRHTGDHDILTLPAIMSVRQDSHMSRELYLTLAPGWFHSCSQISHSPHQR